MRHTLGPNPHDKPAPESADVVMAAMDKLSEFYEAKTLAPDAYDSDLDMNNHRYYPLAYGEPNEDGVYRWAVWDNLEDRFMSSAEVLNTPLERLMDARLAQ